MKALEKKLSGCASNSLAHEDLGHFEEAHHWNIQAKFYNEKFQTYETIAWLVIGVVHDLNTLCGEDRA